MSNDQDHIAYMVYCVRSLIPGGLCDGRYGRGWKLLARRKQKYNNKAVRALITELSNGNNTPYRASCLLCARGW